jgi:hypothetical protein
MADLHNIIGAVYNHMRTNFNSYLDTVNASTVNALNVSHIDKFSFGGPDTNPALRSCGVYSNGQSIYQAGYGEGEEPNLVVTVDLLLADSDYKLIYKYATHIKNFLNAFDIGISGLVTDLDIFQKQSGSNRERVAATFEITIDTMEDEDEY